LSIGIEAKKTNGQDVVMEGRATDGGTSAAAHDAAPRL
jgi:hypothetical protein